MVAYVENKWVSLCERGVDQNALEAMVIAFSQAVWAAVGLYERGGVA
jgi:hypothetical protein